MNRYQPYHGGWNQNQEPSRPTQAQDSEVPAWRSFGRNATIEEGVEVPPQEVVTPRPSNRVIRNDNYCALSVHTKDLYNFAHFEMCL